MSELAQELIKACAQARSWLLDILRALPNSEAVAKVRDTARHIAREERDRVDRR